MGERCNSYGGEVDRSITVLAYDADYGAVKRSAIGIHPPLAVL
jgi:hypothetical protein